jgi:photosystem II stability/assembly factor-like uncharacterized protein
MEYGLKRLAHVVPFVTVFLVGFLCCSLLTAQTTLQQITSTEGVSGGRLVSPGVGWAIAHGRLLRTKNNGINWSDITPPHPSIQYLKAVFFLDATHGWIVFQDGSADWEHAPVHLIRTVDGGRTWSPLRFDRTSYAGLQSGTTFPYDFSFVDSQHGWFLWRLMTSSASSAGLLFKTDDGGATWMELPTPPSGNGFRFVTPQNGWTTGDGDGHELWATHDGGKSWQQRMVSAPANCRGCWPNYQNPEFHSSKDALMDVIFSDTSRVDYISVDCTYETHDGGNSWRATEYCGQPIVNSPDFVVRVNMHVLRLSVVADKLRGIEAPPQARGSISGVSFVNDSDGWLFYGFGKRTDVLSTTDGGKTFTVITPPTAPAR